MKLVEAVYENGVLRPLEPLPLNERHVSVWIGEANPTTERSYLDTDYLTTVKAEVAAIRGIPTLDEIHKIAEKDPGSWAEAVTAEREERL